jgi:hypothetical protein
VCRFVFWGVANISVRNWGYPDGLEKFEHRGRAMKRVFLVALAGAPLELATAVTTPVHAGGSDVAAGLIGGLAAGTIIGAAVAVYRAGRNDSATPADYSKSSPSGLTRRRCRADAGRRSVSIVCDTIR